LIWRLLSQKLSLLDAHHVLRQDYSDANGVYTISTCKTFESFQGATFIISNLKENTLIKSMTIDVKSDNFTYKKLKFMYKDNFTTSTDEFVMKGSKLEFNIITPEQLDNYSGELEFNISLRIGSNDNFFVQKVLQHPKWRTHYLKNQNILNNDQG